MLFGGGTHAVFCRHARCFCRPVTTQKHDYAQKHMVFPRICPEIGIWNLRINLLLPQKLLLYNTTLLLVAAAMMLTVLFVRSLRIHWYTSTTTSK
jgi:hypothetical protein